MNSKPFKQRVQKVMSLVTVLLILGNVTLPSVTVLADTLKSTQEVSHPSDSKNEQTETSSFKKVTDETSSSPIETEDPATSIDQPMTQPNAPPTPFELRSLLSEDSNDVLSIGKDGNLYYNGEAVFYPDGQVPANLQELYKKGVATTLTPRMTRASVGAASIEYIGPVTWGYHTVGNFRVNGKQAFCIQHPVGTPPTGTPNGGLEPYNNRKIQAVLYWGWGGPKNIFSDAAAGIVATSLALSYFYYGDGPYNSLPDGYNTLIIKANAEEVPQHDMFLNNTHNLVTLGVTYSGGIQKSTTATITADSANSITFTVPADITFKNETTGATATNKAVTVYGGQKFHFEANANVGKSFSSGSLKGTVKEFQPLVVKPLSGGLQNLGTWRWYDDPANTVSFSVDFVKREGNVTVRKVDAEDYTKTLQATYKATRLDTNEEKTIQTNSGGSVDWYNLPSGTKVRYVEEIAPPGYVIDKTPIDMTVVAGETKTHFHANKKQVGTLSLDKTTQLGGKTPLNDRYTLLGNTYNVYAGKTATGTPVTTLSTDLKGQALSKPLPLGFYTLVETKASQGLLLNKVPVTVEIKYAGQEVDVTNQEVSVVNKEQLGTARLFKEDTTTGKTPVGTHYSLDGAIYGLFRKDGTKVSSVTLKSVAGRVQADVPNLALGDYYWQEEKAPQGYVIDKSKLSFSLTYAGQDQATVLKETTAKDQPQLGTARLFKEDTTTGHTPYGDKYSLDGAIYGLFKEDGTKVTSVLLKTKDGKVQSEVAGLLLGNYYWQEEKAPEGYVIDKSKLTFSLTYAGQDKATTLTEKTAKDMPQLGLATLIKEDTETGNTPQGEAVLEGAVYGLFQVDGKKIKSVTLKNVNGKIQADVSDLKLGDYYWQEEKAPIGYQLNTKKIPFSLTYAGESVATSTKTTTAKDDVKKGGFDLFKFGNYDWQTTAWNWLTGKDTSSEQKQGLAGAEFTVTQHYGAKKEVARKVTGKDGHLAFSGLVYGTYRVRETQTPNGYKTVEDFYLTISEHGQTFHYSIENKVKEANLQLVKIDSESGKAIPRAEAGFEIYSETTGEQLRMSDLSGKEQAVFFTDKEGYLKLPTMFAHGSYRIKEVEAPTGYVRAKEEVTFSVTGDEKEGIVMIRFQNDNQKGQLELHKTVQTATHLVTETTDYGEITTIEYTQQSGSGFKFKIKATKDIVTSEGTVKQEAGTFVQSEGEDIVLTTNKTGEAVSVPILYIGSYELVEVEAPAGVVMLKSPQPFEIEYGGQLVAVTSTTVSVENDTQTVTLIGYKSQEVIEEWKNGQAVIALEKATNGQVFALRNETDQPIGEETLPANTTLAILTVEEGELHYSGHLPQGNYYLEEISAGESHVLNPDKIPFEYKAVDNLDSQTIHVWADSVAINKQGLTKLARNPILNKLARATVQLIKTDALDGKVLENVAFNLVRIEGDGEEITETIISKHATDAEGKIVVEHLPTGTYKFIETRPLEWYEANEEELRFSVTPELDGTLIELDAVNQRKPLEITTLFATTKDGLKQLNPDIDNDLTDTIRVKGAKEGHTYYVETFYVNPKTKKVLSQSEFDFVGNGETDQLLTTDLSLPKGTMADNEEATATHIFYEDEEKTKEIGREDDLENKDQTVLFKTPKVTIKTKAHMTDEKTQTFTHGELIAAFDNVALTHEDVLDGTKRAFKTILVAVIPDKDKTKEETVWESEKIDYVVKDATIVEQVKTEVDTGKYPVGTTFFFKEIGYNEAGEEDTRHNEDGKDKDQTLTPLAPKKSLPKTGEQMSSMGLVIGLGVLLFAVCLVYLKKHRHSKQIT